MQPRIHVITLAVDDLDRAVGFYRDGLGLQTSGVIGTEFPGDDSSPAGAVAMFQLQAREGGVAVGHRVSLEVVGCSGHGGSLPLVDGG